MEPAGLQIERRDEDGVCVLALTGELDLAVAARVPQALGRLGPDRAGGLLLDLRGVTFMDSTGVRALLRARRWAYNHGAAVRFVCFETGVGETLRLMGLREVLEPLEDFEQALGELRASGRPGAHGS